jgi:cytochrome c5
MFRHFSFALILCFGAACSPADDGRPASVSDSEVALVSGSLPGQRAYERACARCHEQGLDGAPATGDSESWADRSSLWVAVLAEHARVGYLDMPSRGGEPDLTDQEVTAAAEYMLTLTHPDRPAD